MKQEDKLKAGYSCDYCFYYDGEFGWIDVEYCHNVETFYIDLYLNHENSGSWMFGCWEDAKAMIRELRAIYDIEYQKKVADKAIRKMLK